MNDNSGSGDPENDAILAAENEGMDEAVGHPHAKPAEANPLADTVAALEKERDQLKDAVLRALAETDNVRKRANRQIEEARLYAVEKFARDLLNVSDNLARSVDAVPEHSRGLMTDAVKTALEGVELTQKELVSVLARHGVTAVDASPGAAFDPALHQAVTQIPSEHPAGSVAQLFQSGWRIGDRTLRAAMVAVSAGKSGLQ
jgi:molecular chaperone GrpE